MKYVLAAISLLLLVSALMWLLWGGDEDADGLDDVSPGVGRAADEAEGGLTADTPDLAGRGSDQGGRRAGRYPPGSSPLERRAIRTGTLEVLPIGPDDQPISADEVTVRVTSSQSVSGGVHGLRDQKTGLWTFDEVPIGKVSFVVFGERIAEYEDRAVVREGVSTYVKASVLRGATLHYRVERVDGSLPETVTLQLVDHRGMAVPVRWQVRTQTVLTQPQRKTKITQGPDGHAFAIRPGEYTLKATVASGESAEGSVVLAPGDSEDVHLILRR